MSGIFISYSQSDRAKAQMLAAALERDGWSVWWDLKIPPGKTFDEVIKQALDRAKCVIVLWSKTSVRSKWVKTEATVANRRGILIPALIDDDAEIPLEFLLLQASRLTEWQGQSEDPQLAALKSSVAELLGDIAQPSADGNDSARRKAPGTAAATPQELREKREGSETKLRDRVRWPQIHEFLNACRQRLWILGLTSLVFLMLAGFIWLKYWGTPLNPQLKAVTTATQSDKILPDLKPPTNGDKQPSPLPKTPTSLPHVKETPPMRDSIVVDGELTWTRTDNGEDIDWDGANQYCRELMLDGVSGWRLPTIDELSKLYDPTGGHDRNIRRPFRLTGWWVWSSTKRGPGSAFYYSFDVGVRDINPLEQSDNHALCVRGSGE